MKTFKGTKGDWLTDNAEPRKVYACNDGSHVSISIGIKRSDQENRANAKLIASAPELLKALQGLSELIDNGDLVRDISKDDDKSYYISQGLRIVQAIGKYQKAINQAL